MSRMVIDDELWIRLKELLPKPKGRHGKDDRLFMEAFCWMLRTGAAWRDLPATYGNRHTTTTSIKREILLRDFFKKLNASEELRHDMIKKPECTSTVLCS